MAVPPVRADGTLPPGIHRATLDEVFAAYPPVSQQRQLLNQELNKLVAFCKSKAAVIELIIDGSYVTSKNEPEDIDAVLLFNATIKVLTVESLGEADIDTTHLVDAWVETEVWYRKWVTFFQMTMGDSQAGTPGYTKGVVQIIW